jgi:hypothetical protein
MDRLRNFLLPAVAAALFTAGATPAVAASNRYQQTNLVSDGTIAAAHVDPNLVNAWGIAFNPRLSGSPPPTPAARPCMTAPVIQPLVVQIPLGRQRLRSGGASHGHRVQRLEHQLCSPSAC